MTQGTAQKEGVQLGEAHRGDLPAAAGAAGRRGCERREMVRLAHPPTPVTHQFLPKAKTPRSWWV